MTQQPSTTIDLTSLITSKQTNLSRMIEPWVNEALDQHANGERVMWDIGLIPMQSHPGAPPEPTTVMVMWVPGAVLDSVITGHCPLPNPLALDEQNTGDLVVQFLRHLREQRSQQLAQMSPISGGAG